MTNRSNAVRLAGISAVALVALLAAVVVLHASRRLGDKGLMVTFRSDQEREFASYAWCEWLRETVART